MLGGSLKFLMEPYSATVLKQGDSVHCDGVMPHGFVAAGDEDAWILSVCLSEKAISEIMAMPKSVASLSKNRKWDPLGPSGDLARRRLTTCNAARTFAHVRTKGGGYGCNRSGRSVCTSGSAESAP